MQLAVALRCRALLVRSPRPRRPAVPDMPGSWLRKATMRPRRVSKSLVRAAEDVGAGMKESAAALRSSPRALVSGCLRRPRGR